MTMRGKAEPIAIASAAGKLAFGILAALAEFERELILERTKAGLIAARVGSRHGGRPCKMTPAKLRPAWATMDKPETEVVRLCEELGITRQTLYRPVGPHGAAHRRQEAARADGAAGGRFEQLSLVRACFGGVYIAASLAWLWAVEGVRPDGWDVTGAVICLVGAAVIVLGPRAVA
jgi:hypothetical protein